MADHQATATRVGPNGSDPDSGVVSVRVVGRALLIHPSRVSRAVSRAALRDRESRVQ